MALHHGQSRADGQVEGAGSGGPSGRSHGTEVVTAVEDQMAEARVADPHQTLYSALDAALQVKSGGMSEHSQFTRMFQSR